MEREDGFTLIELVMTITILAIIMPVIAGSVIVGLKTTDDTSARLNQSHDVQNATAFFEQDVASADDVSLTDTTCAGVAPIVRLRWTDPVTSHTIIASYFVRTSATEKQLVRRLCDNGTQTNETPVSHFLSDTVPTATCTPAASCPGRPKTVKLQLESCDRTASFTCDGGTLLNYSLIGALRDAG